MSPSMSPTMSPTDAPYWKGDEWQKDGWEGDDHKPSELFCYLLLAGSIYVTSDCFFSSFDLTLLCSLSALDPTMSPSFSP